MTSKTDAGPSRRSIAMHDSARTLAAELALTLIAAIKELKENPQTADGVKIRHDLIMKNIRSLSLLVDVEEKLEKRIQTRSGGNGETELRLSQARDEIANRIARLAAAGEG